MAQSEHVSPLTKENIGPVDVFIIDDATNGCWTNIAEAEGYAKDQLGLAGLRTSGRFKSSFDIRVVSERTPAGRCYGVIRVSSNSWVDWEGGRTYVSLAEALRTFTGAENANIFVLDSIKDFATGYFAELPEE